MKIEGKAKLADKGLTDSMDIGFTFDETEICKLIEEELVKRHGVDEADIYKLTVGKIELY